MVGATANAASLSKQTLFSTIKLSWDRLPVFLNAPLDVETGPSIPCGHTVAEAMKLPNSEDMLSQASGTSRFCRRLWLDASGWVFSELATNSDGSLPRFFFLRGKDVRSGR